MANASSRLLIAEEYVMSYIAVDLSLLNALEMWNVRHSPEVDEDYRI